MHAMKNPRWFNSKTAIIIAGVILTAYLILILTVANLGQSRLAQSQDNALNLKVSHYTDNLSQFLAGAEKNIFNLSENRQVNAYFSNLAAGMSLQYGLGSSLFNLRNTMAQFSKSNNLGEEPIYLRLMIVGFGETVIADTQPDRSVDMSKIPFQTMDKVSSKINMLEGENGPSIQLLQTIYNQDVPVAVLIATINNDVIIHQLSMLEDISHGSCLTLATPIGAIPVWNSLPTCTLMQPDGVVNHLKHADGLISFIKDVQGTELELISQFKPVRDQDIFTSAWFIAAISLLALPVLLGLIYLMRVNNANLILQTQVSAAAAQQQKLTRQNSLLHDEINRRKVSESRLAYQATHDELTHLFNRSHVLARLEKEINNTKSNDSSILVLFLDLDNFKQVNDNVGHHAGDQLLKQAGDRLLQSVRGTEIVARLGGDEFLVIIPKLSHHDLASVLANRILSLFEKPFHIEGLEFFISTSIGMSIYPRDGDNAATLLKNADTALYRAKDAGRNGYSFYDNCMKFEMERNLALNVRLHQAMECNDIEVYYQPILDLTSRKIVAAEALVRWTDRELGVVSPAEFIPLAERNGLIHRLGDIVLQEACSQAASWQAICPIKIAINFSSVQFRYCEQLQMRIIEVLQQTGLPSTQLDMEVTESLLIDQGDSLATMLSNLKQLGIGLSIDDFGTGYSALSYLQKFSFSKLKIDQAFINKMAISKADRALVEAILAMAKSLALTVVAEGIEEQQQALFLQQHGCEYGQGYLFSRPLPAAEFAQLLVNDQLVNDQLVN